MNFYSVRDLRTDSKNMWAAQEGFMSDEDIDSLVQEARKLI